jgi:hypothetical protein
MGTDLQALPVLEVNADGVSLGLHAVVDRAGGLNVFAVGDPAGGEGEAVADVELVLGMNVVGFAGVDGDGHPHVGHFEGARRPQPSRLVEL